MTKKLKSKIKALRELIDSKDQSTGAYLDILEAHVQGDSKSTELKSMRYTALSADAPMLDSVTISKKKKKVKSKRHSNTKNTKEVQYSSFTQWLQDKSSKSKTSSSKNDLKAKIDASATLQDEVITEAMAKLYVQTGDHKAAIKVYEKLGLKYPEKSTLFASQIEKLKEKL